MPRLARVCWVGSVAGFIGAVVIMLTSFLPTPPVLSLGLLDYLLIGALGKAFAGVHLLRRRARRDGEPRVVPITRTYVMEMSPAPPSVVRAYCGYVFVALIVGGVSIFMSMGGQPGAGHGHYWLNDHGVVTNISHAAYIHASAVQQRMFSAFCSLAYGLGCLSSWPAEQRRGGCPDRRGSS
jgi:hypothetical protein